MRTPIAFSNIFVWNLRYSTLADTRISNAGTGTAVGSDFTFTGQTAWTKYSQTVTIPSDASSLGFVMGTYNNTVATANFDITGVQLELGAQSTPFARAGGSIGGELALCQRYYDKRGGQTGTSTILNNALSNSAGTNAAFNFAINMRVAPTLVEFGSLRLSDTSSGFTVSSVTLTNCTPTTGNVNVATSGMTGFRSCYLDGSATGNFIAFSAEL
jgi:hypothetical protein